MPAQIGNGHGTPHINSVVFIFTHKRHDAFLSFTMHPPPNSQPRHCGGNVRHVHLSVGPDPSTQMIVSFASTPSNLAAPVGGVLVGTSPSQLDRVVIEEETGSFRVIKIKWKAMEEDKTEDEFDQRRLIKHPPCSGWKKPCPSSSKI
jgi:hypothetical protein